MTALVDEWDDGALAPAPTPASQDAEPGEHIGEKERNGRRGGEGKKPPPLVFKNVEEFVREYVAPTYRRKLGSSTATWCPEWWRHEEALQRLGAMWRTWENLRLDPVAGMSTWFLQHGDPHMRVLMDPDRGPFAACHPKQGHATRPLEPLPLVSANPALWLSPAFSTEADSSAN